MLRFLSCFTCEQKAQTYKVKNMQPVPPPKSEIKENFKTKQKLNYERKQSKQTTKTTIDTQNNTRSTYPTYFMAQELEHQNSTMGFIQKLQLMEVDKRKQLEYDFVKKNCFARGPKYVVEREWSIQYTDFLKKKRNTLRKVDNNKILCQNARIVTGFEYSKSYFVVSKKVWLLIQKLYGGGPEIQRDRLLPIKELPAFGLTNPKYSCYLNCGIQAIFSIPQFVDYFFSGCFAMIKHKTKHSERFLSSLIQKFLQSISKQQQNSYDLGSLRKYFQSKFSEGHQHDCQQFMRLFIYRLQQQLNPRSIIRQSKQRKLTQQQVLDEYDQTHGSIVDSLFHGQLSSYIKCGNCQNVSVVHDPIMEMTLEMSNQSLEQSIKSYFSAQKLTDSYECQRCLKRTKSIRQFFLQKAPLYLMISIKRFLQNQKKNASQLIYPLQLQLDQYFKTTPSSTIDYDLQSVIIHKGQINKGHYYLHTKRQGKWYEINDEMTKRISIQNHLQQEAYVLIYKLF